ncbi:uncharacterized protein TNCV_3810901 [Trichonephila clavipes]|nr:uncharacterized protein TNCV_3810901 [Trichonephila clavipes]
MDLGENSAEYSKWHKSHQEECSENYIGSSNAMEIKAAEILWKRSIKNCVYQRFAKDKPLERCFAGKTQNANKSIHCVIWKNCPKETIVSKKRLEMRVISAIRGYNSCCLNRLAIEHNELSVVSVDISHKRDKRRLAQSEKKNSGDWKKKRMSNKLAKSSKMTKNIKKEDETYGPGKF